MGQEDAHAALASFFSSLATQHDSPDSNTFSGHDASNSTKLASPKLPGPDTAGKQALERELAALTSRIQQLEVKASRANASLPITPSEPLSASFDLSSTTPTLASPPRPASAVSSILAKREHTDGDTVPRQLTEEQLGLLRDHVDRQADQIKTQREYIKSINIKLDQQQQATTQALSGIESSMDDVETLKRELQKNQQINSTYQKVLREIGSIVTAVANGDLSKKVLISAKERDPEIATFKRTINKMVDQLQQFASQVTHLAREVGTEGRLGGQAVVHGVDGIWAELTQNGVSARCTLPCHQS